MPFSRDKLKLNMFSVACNLSLWHEHGGVGMLV
uniref:Uncharacterized protein n=1 Tax=Anguilla anguilla TaxID=7936 RepID=A0A0E9QKP3_ANGAN